jgi:hypothetical protein
MRLMKALEKTNNDRMIAGLIDSRNQIIRVGNTLASFGQVPCVTPVGVLWSCSKHFPTAPAVGYVVASRRDSHQGKIIPLPSSETDRLSLSTNSAKTSPSSMAAQSGRVLRRISGLNCREKGVYGWLLFERLPISISEWRAP